MAEEAESGDRCEKNLAVGRDWESVKSKEASRGKREFERNESKADMGRLKLPSTKSGEPSSGKLIKVSRSLRNSSRALGR